MRTGLQQTAAVPPYSERRQFHTFHAEVQTDRVNVCVLKFQPQLAVSATASICTGTLIANSQWPEASAAVAADKRIVGDGLA